MTPQVLRRIHDVLVIDGVGHRPIFEPKTNLGRYRLENITGTVQNAHQAGFHSISETHQLVNDDATHFNDMLTWTGEWVAVLSNAESGRHRGSELRFMLAADYFGFGKLHYAVVPSQSNPGQRTIVAGPSFRGVVQVLKDLGQKSNIRWDVALPHVVSHVNPFRTRASRKTFSDKVDVLAQGEVLLVSESGMSISSRPSPDYAMDYTALIDRGIETAIADAKSASSLGLQTSISLSGGKDSRALFAMSSAGGVARDWQVITKRPGTQASASTEIFRNDLRYASLIVDRFNLDWHMPKSGHHIEANFRESLNEYQDFRSNESFDSIPQKYLRREAAEATTMGIGGELFRSYIAGGYRDGHPQWWATPGKTAESAYDDLRSLFSRLAEPWKIPQNLYNQAASTFAESMTFDVDGSALDHIDKSYGEYRSRAFSANMEMSRHAGSYLTYPLARPEFVAASQLLSSEDRDDARVLFDIIERCSADLNALPFAAPPWSERFESKGRSSTWEHASVDRAEAKYQSKREESQPIPVVRRDLTAVNFDKEASQHIGMRLEMLREFDPSDLVDPIILRAARRSLMSKGSLYSLLAVVESISDAAAPTEVDTCKLHLNASSATRSIVSSRELRPMKISFTSRESAIHGQVSDFENTVFGQEITLVDLSQVTARIVAGSTTSTVCVLIEDLPANVEAAIYIYSGGERLSRTPYHALTIFEFPEVPETKIIDRATVFLRWRGDPDALRVFDIGP